MLKLSNHSLSEIIKYVPNKYKFNMRKINKLFRSLIKIQYFFLYYEIQLIIPLNNIYPHEYNIASKYYAPDEVIHKLMYRDICMSIMLPTTKIKATCETLAPNNIFANGNILDKICIRCNTNMYFMSILKYEYKKLYDGYIIFCIGCITS